MIRWARNVARRRQFTEPVRGESGEIEAALGLLIDVDANLRETRGARYLMDVINALPIVVWAMDAAGVCTLSAGKLLERLGFAPGQLVGKDVREIYGADPATVDQVRRALAGETFSVETPLAGRLWLASYYPARNGLGEITGAISVVEDITDRRQDERRIREQLATIQAQQHAIAELVSPIIEVWRGVLVVPIIGTLGEDQAAVPGERTHATLAEALRRCLRSPALRS